MRYEIEKVARHYRGPGWIVTKYDGDTVSETHVSEVDVCLLGLGGAVTAQERALQLGLITIEAALEGGDDAER